MKTIKFTKRAKDKKTGEKYAVGTIKEFANARAEEIISKGFAVSLETPPEEAIIKDIPDNSEDVGLDILDEE